MTKKNKFEQIRRLVANQQIVYGNTEQLQAIYEICNEEINKQKNDKKESK